MTGSNPRRRRDDRGCAYAGSQLQVQLYVNRFRGELDRSISEALRHPADVVLDWRSPLEDERFAEYMDGAFLRALGLSDLRQQLKEFWPRSGPRWDGLAVMRNKGIGEPGGYLLVEGKSYPEEVYGSGCASPPGSPNRDRIDAALAKSANELQAAPTADWSGRLYQYANRLAHVGFLHQATGKPVWLINLCFTDDPRTPNSRDDWQDALTQIKAELGFPQSVPYSVDVFLPARPRDALAPSTDSST